MNDLQFNDFRFDGVNACLWRGEEEIRLTPKAFAVLQYLLNHRGRLVTREQLLEAVWPGVVVNDTAPASAIRELRKALDDDAKTPRYIETIHRRGYRFIGQLSKDEKPTTVSHVSALPNSRKIVNWHYWVAVAFVFVMSITGFFYLHASDQQIDSASEAKLAYPLPDKPSLVVIPFANLNGDSAQDYLVDGITDNITTALAKIPKLFVIARNSSFAYKGEPISVKQVAAELGVRYVLQGSVQRDDNHIRINTQLIDTVTGHYLWAEDYDQELNTIFAFQDDITTQVATELEVKLTHGEMARVWRRQTDKPEAYHYLLQGIERFNAFTELDVQQALQLFEKTVALDSGFAGAWSWLGWTYHAQAKQGWVKDRAAAFERASELAHKALIIDSHNADAYALLGSIHWYHHKQFEKAVEYSRKAVELDPNFADNLVVLAIRLVGLGQTNEALVLVKKAMRINPHYPGWYPGTLGWAYLVQGEYDKAITELEKTLGYYPDSRISRSELAAAYAYAGKSTEARAAVAKIRELHPTFTIAEYAKIEVMPAATFQHLREGMLKAGLPP